MMVVAMMMYGAMVMHGPMRRGLGLSRYWGDSRRD
jgi:hypothetical protein